MKRFIPRMGGVWSIWLTSTIMGIKFFTFEGITANFLVLFSVKPFLENKGKLYLLPPILLSGIIFYGILRYPMFAVLLFPYLILFLLQRAKISQRVYVMSGAFLLTIPFPLMVGFYGEENLNAIIPTILLISITFFNLFLAESVIFRKSMCKENYLLLFILFISFLFLTPFIMFATLSMVAVLLMFFAFRLSLRKLGFSMLVFHLLFAIEYLIFF